MYGEVMTKEDVRAGRLARARSSLPTQLNLALALNQGLLDIEASLCLTRSFSLLPQTGTEHRENPPQETYCWIRYFCLPM